MSQRFFEVLGELTRKAQEVNGEAVEIEFNARKQERAWIVAYLRREALRAGKTSSAEQRTIEWQALRIEEEAHRK